jgi:hypothetical protein
MTLYPILVALIKPCCRKRRESPYARSGKGRQSGNICTVHGLPLSTACIEYRMWGRGNAGKITSESHRPLPIQYFTPPPRLIFQKTGYPSFADSAPRCRAMNRSYTHGTILGLRMAWEIFRCRSGCSRGIGKNRGRLIPDWVPIRGGRAEVCPGQTCMAQRQNSNRIDRTSVLRERSCPSPETTFGGPCGSPNRCYPVDLW